MTVAELLQQAAEAGLHLRAEGDRLIVEGPDETLSSGLIQALRDRKAELLAVLAEADGTSDAVLEELPLAAKLRVLGEPFPLVVDGRVAAWLVPDTRVARATVADEPIYTAEEVETAAQLPAADLQRLHQIKAQIGGRITEEEHDE